MVARSSLTRSPGSHLSASKIYSVYGYFRASWQSQGSSCCSDHACHSILVVTPSRASNVLCFCGSCDTLKSRCWDSYFVTRYSTMSIYPTVLPVSDVEGAVAWSSCQVSLGDIVCFLEPRMSVPVNPSNVRLIPRKKECRQP